MQPGQYITTSVTANDYVPIQTPSPVNTVIQPSILQSFQASFATSAQSNSTSVTLSAVFTALTYTQTSTGNTVHLKAAPANGEIQGFSANAIITNLTVSSAANTVSNGAIATTVAGNTFWWIFNSADSTWYRYNGR